MSDEGEDRASILARRAILVASTLAAAGVASRATADEPLVIPEPCPSRQEPTAAELEEARRLVEEAGKPESDPRMAVTKLSRAYTIAPRPGLAALLMNALERADQLDDAFDIGERELRCGGPNPELQQRVRELEASTGVLQMIAIANAAGISIGGKPVAPARAAAGTRLMPGTYKVDVFFRNGGHQTLTTTISAGGKTHLLVDETQTPPPEPCLSISRPEPCLSISHGEEREEKFALHFGLVPTVLISNTDPITVHGGGGPRLGFAVQAAKNLWFDGDIFTTYAFGDDDGVALGGTIAELRYHPGGMFGFGLGFAAGVTAPLTTDYPEGVEPPSDGFFGPVVVPASLLAGDALVELRVPFLFTATLEGQPRKDLSFGIIAPQLVVSWGIKDKYLARMF